MQARLRSLSPLWEQVRSVLFVGLLTFSWGALCFWTMLITEGWLAPWDAAPIRPPAGHWQRSLNDFFESGVGAYVPTAIFLRISGLLYAYTLNKTQDVGATSLAFGSTNFVALAAVITFGVLIQLFVIGQPTELAPEAWSYWGDYRRQWPLILMAFGVFVGLFSVQPRFARRLAEVNEGIE